MKVIASKELEAAVASELLIKDPAPEKCIALLAEEGEDDNRVRSECSTEGGE